MQAIGFNEHYGLQTAVFEGWKTMTRRFEKGLENLEGVNEEDLSFIIVDGRREVHIYDDKPGIEVIKSRYKIGEVVAVKQSYKEIASYPYFISQCAANEQSVNDMMLEKGWNNKMFVAAYYMPHHIRITDIRCERLQEISNEDCLKEGVIKGKFKDFPNDMFYPYKNCKDNEVSWTAKYAFAKLIDKVSGNGTWDSNPYVFVYEFELVK